MEGEGGAGCLTCSRGFSVYPENGTNVKTEILAGVTTFLTMAYIIFVQPAVLSKDFAGNPTGMDFGAVLLATCVASAITTVFMGLFANYPIALGPGMGENFFFVSVIMALTALGINDAWSVALGIVFIPGVIFLILSLLRVREVIINAVSPSMRSGIAVGIGLFITFIGLKHSTLIIAKPGTMVGLNTHFISTDMAVFSFGLIVSSILKVRRVRGSILWGILAATVMALFLGEIRPPEAGGLFGFPEISQPAAFRMNLQAALSLMCWPFIVVFLFMDIFDTIGTLIGVAETAGFVKDNKLPRANRVLINVKRIEWPDASESIPAFLTMAGIPFCFSIADGLALGFISYPIIKLFSGRGKDVSWLMYLLSFLLLAYFIFIRAQLFCYAKLIG